MRRTLILLMLLCLLCGSFCLSEEEEVQLDAPVEEITVSLGGEDEPEPTEVPTVPDDYGDDDWRESDYIIPYPDVTSAEIRNQLKPSKRVYPGKLVWPLPGTPVLGHLTSHVGWRNAARIHSHQGGTWPSWLHHGIDVGNVKKGHPVAAVADGLAYAGYRRGEGLYVVIDHQNGFYTEYQHLSGFAGAVTRGCRAVPVKAGDLIGAVGNSGGDYPVHFHFEIAWSPKGGGSDDKTYFKRTKSRSIRAYSFPQESVVTLHWPKTWELCTAENQIFVPSVEALAEPTKTPSPSE